MKQQQQRRMYASRLFASLTSVSICVGAPHDILHSRANFLAVKGLELMSSRKIAIRKGTYYIYHGRAYMREISVNFIQLLSLQMQLL